MRLWGIAEEPFWPAPNGSSTSRTSVRARCRISSAKRSSDDASTASAERSSAWRSRWRICVELGAGSSPSASHAIRSTSGVVVAYVPTAPESLPTRIPASACSSRSAVALELECPAQELEPEGRRLGVHAVGTADGDRAAMFLGARIDRVHRPIDACADQLAGGLDGERERRVERRPTRSGRSETTVRPRRDRPTPRRRRRRRRGWSSRSSSATRSGLGTRARSRTARALGAGTVPTSAHASSTASSTASQVSSFDSSDQTLDISGLA